MTQTVREFSRAGPCVTLGEFVKRTPHKIFFRDCFGDLVWRFHRNQLIHVEPCRSCRDHPATQYPDGYTD
jgi:hypothetical protein